MDQCRPIDWAKVQIATTAVEDAMGACMRSVARAMTAGLRFTAAPDEDVRPEDFENYSAWFGTPAAQRRSSRARNLERDGFDGPTFTGHEERLGRHWDKLRRAINHLNHALDGTPLTIDAETLQDARAAVCAVLGIYAKLGMRIDDYSATRDHNIEGEKVRVSVIRTNTVHPGTLGSAAETAMHRIDRLTAEAAKTITAKEA
jgi:hypothetical protein